MQKPNLLHHYTNLSFMQGTKMMFLFPAFLSLSFTALSQTKDKNIKMGDTMLYTERDSLYPVYNWVEEMPQIEGGNKALKEYIAQYPYPQCGLEANLEGKVVIQFIVEKDGSISGTQVISSPDPCLSMAALNNLSGWKPGKFNKEIVACLYTLPIEYNINEYKNRVKKEK